MIPNFYDGLIPNKFEDLMMLSSASICLAPIKLERSYGECGERQKRATSTCPAVDMKPCLSFTEPRVQFQIGKDPERVGSSCY